MGDRFEGIATRVRVRRGYGSAIFPALEEERYKRGGGNGEARMFVKGTPKQIFYTQTGKIHLAIR